MHDYVCFIAPIDYCVELSLMHATFCENCSHFILKWFQPNSCWEVCFLEDSYENMQKKSNFENFESTLYSTSGSMPLIGLKQYFSNVVAGIWSIFVSCLLLQKQLCCSSRKHISMLDIHLLGYHLWKFLFNDKICTEKSHTKLYFPLYLLTFIVVVPSMIVSVLRIWFNGLISL